MRDTGGRVTLAIHALPKPVIAAINGPAVGIGATMTLAMDLRLASTKARIGFVFGRLGIVPEAASTWFLPRIVGIQQALEWVYSAEILDADAALAGRLVRSVHEPDELVPAAQELARSFVVGRSATALGLAKQMLYRNGAAADPLEAHLSDSLAMFYTSIGDGKEGVAAFREKRDPEFKGGRSRPAPHFLGDLARPADEDRDRLLPGAYGHVVDPVPALAGALDGGGDELVARAGSAAGTGSRPRPPRWCGRRSCRRTRTPSRRGRTSARRARCRAR